MRRKLALLLLRRFRAAPGLAAIGALTTLGLIASGLQLSFVRRGAVEQHTCIGFIETKGCLPYGEILAVAPRPCAEVIKGTAGYCLCDGNVTVNRVECGAPPFSCQDRCGKAHVLDDAESLPEPITCVGDEGAVTATIASSTTGWPTLPVADVAALDEQAASTWRRLQQLTAAAAPDVCPPAPRTSRHDWVLRGWHMRRQDVQQARQRWQGFLQQLPEFPAHRFRGRGVVLVGGGPKYLVPAWLGISFLRRWGCQLPIEVWFPPSERPPAQVVEQLQLRGATARILPAEGEAGRPGSWFGLKAIALLLSSFQEVLFLDADNLPLADPSPLFEADVYRSTGSLLWQDYWQSTVSAEMLQIVGVDGSMAFPGSFESGQMLLDKRRTWRGLLAAAYFNVHYYLFHNLLSCYMGQGDKETFAMGILATGGALAVVPSPPGSVGVLHPLCVRGWRQSRRGRQRSCPQQFLGNSMMQYDLQGRPLFLHTNLKPKLNLAVPNDFKHYHRRWKWMEPEHRSFQDWSKAALDMDLEQAVWQALKQLRCLPALASYWKEHGEATGAGRGLHPVPLGVNFNSMYGWGLRGCFERWTPLRIVDRLNHALHTAGARVLGWTVDWVARSAAQGLCL